MSAGSFQSFVEQRPDLSSIRTSPPVHLSSARQDDLDKAISGALRTDGLDAALRLTLSLLADHATSEVLAADKASLQSDLDWDLIAADALAVHTEMKPVGMLNIGLHLSSVSEKRDHVIRYYDEVQERPSKPPRKDKSSYARWRGAFDEAKYLPRYGEPIFFERMKPNLLTIGNADARFLMGHLFVLRFMEVVRFRSARHGLPFPALLHVGGESHYGPDAMFAERPDYTIFIDCPVKEASDAAKRAASHLQAGARRIYDEETVRWTKEMQRDFERFGLIKPHFVADHIPEWHERALRVSGSLPPSSSPEAFTLAEFYELLGVFHTRRERMAPNEEF